MRSDPALNLVSLAGLLVFGLLLATPSPAHAADRADEDHTGTTQAMLAGNTRNILLTGFWPPTNEMLRKFSPNPEQNPYGWQGQNWEGRGYDVYAYFPEFPGGTGSNPKGDGDFEVDYQDVSADFWRITDDLHPVAILSYGQGAGPWEIEYNARNLSSWSNDYQSPRQPTPAPPDSSVASGYVRQSTLPVQAIADAINASGIGVSAWVDWSGNPGAFLCEYMAYHDAWYQSLHSDAADSYRCLAAGFTHVASSVSVSDATAAVEIALRETIDYLGSQLEPTCGDGVPEGTEECDDGNTDPGDCCSPTCQYESAATVCRAPAGVCDAADHCDGASALCPADAKLTGECRASAGVCDVAEECDGVANDCPVDAFESPTTECRASAGVCDAADHCDGASAGCPADAKLTSVCRASAGVCDADDFCNGVSDHCGLDLPRNGLPCADGDLCNGDEICVGFVCTAGTPLDCDDEDICTAESCDPVEGCIYHPVVPLGSTCRRPDLPSASPAGRLLLSLLVVGAGATFLARRRRLGA